MFLSKRPSGIYHLFIEEPDGKRKSISTKTKKKSEALEFLRNYKETLKPVELTFLDFQKRFLKYSESFHTWKTTLTYITTFNEMKSFFGDISMSELTRDRIEEFIQTRTRKVSVHAGRKDLINIKAALSWGVANNIIAENNAASIPRIKVPEKLPRYFTKEEFEKLLVALPNNDWKDLVIFAANTGLRQNELINLKWDQIDIPNELVILNNHHTITKSKKVRVVPFNDETREVIQRRDKTSEYVFTFNGEKIKNDFLIHKFKEYVKASRVNPKLNFHSLRHTFASWLVQKGVSIYIVSILMGHADIRTTEIYSHLNKQNFSQAVKKI